MTERYKFRQQISLCTTQLDTLRWSSHSSFGIDIRPIQDRLDLLLHREEIYWKLKVMQILKFSIPWVLCGNVLIKFILYWMRMAPQ